MKTHNIVLVYGCDSKIVGMHVFEERVHRSWEVFWKIIPGKWCHSLSLHYRLYKNTTDEECKKNLIKLKLNDDLNSTLMISEV